MPHTHLEPNSFPLRNQRLWVSPETLGHSRLGKDPGQDGECHLTPAWIAQHLKTRPKVVAHTHL
jgi:hypothetical protein